MANSKNKQKRQKMIRRQKLKARSKRQKLLLKKKSGIR